MGHGEDDAGKCNVDASPNPAPEGGWGWVVAFGLATVLIVTLGPMACFGLIFGSFLESLGEGASGVTLINSVYMCLHSFTGLLANYALKSYSCRQVALVGSLLFFVGNLLTAFATSVTYMIFSFAILPGVGLGLMIPASFHCFNAYFARRRVFVMGIAQTTLSGGVMLYPIVVEKLVDAYGFRGAQAIVAAVTLHATVGALTFIPVPKKTPLNINIKSGVEMLPFTNGKSDSLEKLKHMEVNNSMKMMHEMKLGSKDSLSDISHNVYTEKHLYSYSTKYNSDIEKQGSNMKIIPDSIDVVNMNPGDNEQVLPLIDGVNATNNKFTNNITNSKLECDVPVLSNAMAMRLRMPRASIISTGSLVAAGAGSMMMINSKHIQRRDSTNVRHWWTAIVNFFDLGLLKDLVYVNIALGVAFAYYSDFTFVTLFPLFMFSLNYTLSDTALCIAIGAACDLGGRIAFSLLGIVCDIKSRTVFLIGSACMVVGRTVMVYMHDYLTLNIANGIHGFFRAWIHANFSLVFAEYCPAERFPAAYGLFMAISGLIGISTGPLIVMY
ncbi:Uncharacterized protein GBIM_07591, partial [Gryllus bimaculatus]